MDKNKKDLMILIGIIFVGINYVIYTYFTTIQLNNVHQAKGKYLQQQQRLSELKGKKEAIKNENNEIEKLKKETADFDSKVPTQIDTPKLIYDFYTGCKIYGVSGENVSFQLINQGNASNNQNKVNSGSVNNDKNENFLTLSIDLKVVGDKGNVESFIKNLDNLTTRKLNVKSISLSNGDVINDKNENANNTSIQQNNVPIGLSQNPITVSNKLSADIVFYQYIQKSEKDKLNTDYNYEFYDSQKEGFNSISDMFK